MVRSTEPRKVERHCDVLLGVAQGSNAARFFERGLHPTVGSGQCRWRHRRLEPLVLVLVRRESRRASVGVAKTGRALRSSSRRPVRSPRCASVEMAAPASAGVEDRKHFVTPGGFQSVVRVARDPSQIRRQGRTGVERKLRAGEAAQAVSGGRYVDVATSSLSRVRAVAGVGANEAYPSSATASGRT